MSHRVQRPIAGLIAAAAFVAASAAIDAQVDPSPDRAEPGSIEAIAEETTDLRFVSPWVAYVPESASVPSPSDFLGRIAGAAGELTGSERIYGYFRALAAASRRVRVERIGTTEEGREILLVAIADEQGIRDLPRLKAATAALADPRITSPADAERIIAAARPIYYFNAGLHADETGSPEMVMELAYRLAVSERPMIREIRRRLVVLINPVSNPDGRDKMVDWFYRHLKGRTDYPSLPRQSPPYWGRYVFVEANRDAHQQAQELTRAVFRMFFDYHPTVIHDLHEAIPLLQTWNGTGPYNPNLEPIVIGEFLEMSFHEVTTMTSFGMPGVWTWNFGEGYGHHYLDSIAMNHNAIGRGYETFGNATAETVDRELGPEETTREWYRPLPAAPRLRWSMRDNLNYMQTGCLAILDYSAKHAESMLRNFYRKGRNSWLKGLEGDPYAFVIPARQDDRRRVARMVNLLLRQRIEVGRLAEGVELDEGSFEAGAYVVRLDQPYRNYAVDLLAPQTFPEKTEHTPYDDVSWALPTHYGVETVAIADRRVLESPLVPLAGEVTARGEVSGEGPVFLLRDGGQEALLAARYRLARFAVEIAEVPFSVGGAEFPAGSWVLPEQPGLRDALAAAAAELGVDFVGAPAAPEVARHSAPAPRLGIWVPWADTDSIGWLRWILDREGVPYTYLRDEEIRAGRLGEAVDVIIHGNVDLDLQGQIHGIQAVTGPLAFTRTPEFPSHGEPVASEDITGGIGWGGVANLERFVEEGGVLLTFGKGSTLALNGGLIRNARQLPEGEVFTPGIELVTRFTKPGHPLSYGYPETPSVFRSNFAAYDLPRRWLRMAYCTSCLDGPVDRRHVVLEWGAGDSSTMLVSGGARGLDRLLGRPAILAVPRGRGAVVAYNFNPVHRDLNVSDQRLLWNAILNWRELRASRPR